uniref:DNA-directed RNA polymerase subunit n=1 Tax=Fritschiella tuberosa TaxID=56004 RepID=A0A6H1YCW4_9CHLO|nr:beta' subunit of RNA polymerase [Fritschiella tuberosa]
MSLLSYRGNCIISFSKYSDCLNIFLLNMRKAKLVSFEKKRRSCIEKATSLNARPLARVSKIWNILEVATESLSEKTKLRQTGNSAFSFRSRVFARGSSSFVGNTFKRFETFRDPEKFQEVKLITLRLASPDTIRRWAETRLPNGKVVGLVHNANTLHHNTLKPLKGGLFCERIFGPTKDFQCACGIQKEKNFSRTTSTRLFCLKCDVEYTWSLKRRYQSGYIRLVSPVAHLWYVKETPSFIAVMLDMKRKTLDSVIYCSSTLTIDSSIAQLKNNFMYSKTDFTFVGVEEKERRYVSSFSPATQMQSKTSQKYLKTKVKSKTSNNKMYIPTFINDAESSPFYQNVFWLKTNRENTFLKKQNEIEKSEWVRKSMPSYLRPPLKKFSRDLQNMEYFGDTTKSLFTKNSENFLLEPETGVKEVKAGIEKQNVAFQFQLRKEATNLEKSKAKLCFSLPRLGKRKAVSLSVSLKGVKGEGHCIKKIKPFETRALSYKNWTNFWRIAYKIAKTQVQKQKSFSPQYEHFSGGTSQVHSTESTSSLLTQVKSDRKSASNFFLTTLSFPSYLGLATSEICNMSEAVEKTFFYLKSLSSKEFLLLFYAQKTRKLFKNLPKLSAIVSEKPSLKGFSDKNSREKSDKLHLSITTFPVFLHIVMYLFQHCDSCRKSEIVGLENSRKRSFFASRKSNYKLFYDFAPDLQPPLRAVSLKGGRETERKHGLPIFSSIRFVYSFLRKQNILMASLILKLKDIIKYWFIFKNFIFFHSILIKNNYSLKTILGNLNEFNLVSTKTKLDLPTLFPCKDAFSNRKSMVKSQTKVFNLRYFQNFPVFSKPRLREVENFLFGRREKQLVYRKRLSNRNYVFFCNSFPASSKNGSFLEQFSFWAQEFQFSSGNKMLILEKRFLMFRYFIKLSKLRTNPTISYFVEQAERKDVVFSISPLVKKSFAFLFEQRRGPRFSKSERFGVSLTRLATKSLSEKPKLRGERELLYENLSSVNISYAHLKQNKFKKIFYQRELSFFLCIKLFQQLKVSKHVLSVSQFPQKFEVNEHKMDKIQKFVSRTEKFKNAKINYFFGEIPSFGLPRVKDVSKILRFENMTEFAAKNSFLDSMPDNLTLLFDKLNNSLLLILLEMKIFELMNLSNMITTLKRFNKTWYSKRTPFSSIFDVNLSWTKIGNNGVTEVGYKTSFLERSWVGFFSKLDFRKKAILSFQHALVGPGPQIQLGLVEKLIRFEKLNRNLLIFNKVNNNFTLLKAVKPIYIENYLALNTVLNLETIEALWKEAKLLSKTTWRTEGLSQLRPPFTWVKGEDKEPPLRSKENSFPNFAYLDKVIYFESIETGYLDLFFSLYFNNFSFGLGKKTAQLKNEKSSKRQSRFELPLSNFRLFSQDTQSPKFTKYTLLKRRVLLKKQLAFGTGTPERVSSISKLQKNKIQFIDSNSSDMGKIRKLNETCDSRGYVCLKNSSFSLHKYFRFITRKSWNSGCVEEKEVRSDFVASNFSQLFYFSSYSNVNGQRFGGLHKSDQFVSSKSVFTGALNLVPASLQNISYFGGRAKAKRERERRTSIRLYNNIYVLSNRYFWDLDEDLQSFLHYFNEPSSPSDVCIPTYADRLLKSNLFRDPPPVLGGGLIQKFLGEFHPNECSKILMVLEKSLKTVNLLLKSCDDFLEARTLRLKRNYILRRLKYIRSGSYKFTDDFLRFSVNKTPKEISNRKFVTIGNNLNTTFKLKNLRSFLKESRPEWMVLSLLPVLPPDLRPILQIGNQVAASDLNRLYQKVIYRNERLRRFLKDSTSTNSAQIKFAYRLLQEAVDNLIDNGKGKGTPETDNRGLPLKSLTELLKGKKGRFRQNLLGKRVDYSGRSVIVVGPRLRLHECGLPKEMAIELFLPFLIQKIFQSGKAVTILGAKLLLKTDPTQTWEFLTMVLRENPVLLNRAPTLHRFGFQAFQPRLVEGKAILLHPLVCPAFNADFDGDQMAVHVPITAEAKVEAWKLMLARNHLLSASTGEGMLLPSQDMVLGCYYLTATNPKLYQKNSFSQQYNYIFTSIEEVLQAYESQKINLHSFIWLRWNGKFQTNEPAEKLLELQISTKGQIAKIFKNYVIYVDSSAAVKSIFIKTTPGRVLFYNFLFNS